MEKPPPKPKEQIPWWQLPGQAILHNPVIRRMYGLDKKPTTLGEMKPKEK